MAYTQRFAKNTDTPPRDSPLWLVGDQWKRSQKTNIDYSPIAGIADDTLLVACRQQSRIDVKDRDYIEYDIEAENEDQTVDTFKYYFYVTDFNGNGKFSVFAFEDEDGAKKKKAEAIKFAGYNQNTQEQQTGQQKLVSAPKTTSIITANTTNKTLSENPVLLKQDQILTYTDPHLVSNDNTEQMATLIQDGYQFIPSSIVRNNVFETRTIDPKTKTETKNIIYLMGKIINVKAEDNTDTPVGA
jgi:hypothetical protein